VGEEIIAETRPVGKVGAEEFALEGVNYVVRMIDYIEIIRDAERLAATWGVRA
jgi:hypothetical protein